jgi:hypothetical protein
MTYLGSIPNGSQAILTEGEFFPYSAATGADGAAILVAPLPTKIGWRTLAAARATVILGPNAPR